MSFTQGLTDVQLRATAVPTDVTDRVARILGHVTVDNASIAVTGAFFQATQPVSGTFWQATQPVSLAVNTPDVTDRAARLLGHVTVDNASIPVTGTFWQVTQPVSGPLTDAQLRATAVPVSGAFFQVTQPVSLAINTPDVTDRAARLLGHVTVDNASIPVTGTFWQATQPVSNATQLPASLGQKAAAASLAVVLPNDANGATAASALFVQRKTEISYTAIYRLAARPYALSKAAGAASRTQFATIHHTAASTKTVKLKRVEIALESSSAASVIVADLVRITTAPATGNPAITPSKPLSDNASAEAVCLALPTTAATEGNVVSFQEWNLGITAAASTVNPPPGLNWYTLWPQTQGAPEAEENQYPTLKAGTLEGFAVTIDSSIASTIKGYIVIEFTEI